jgi:signal transduction histidine kinase
VQAQAAARRVSVQVLPSPAALWVQGDGDKLTQIVLNVLLNAVQFSPDGGVVEVRAEEENLPHGRFAVVCVTDQGPGIAAADRERIFDPFFSTRADGTGLGLAIANRLVDEHHGYIEVTGEPGHGARFRLLLPAAAPSAGR